MYPALNLPNKTLLILKIPIYTFFIIYLFIPLRATTALNSVSIIPLMSLKKALPAFKIMMFSFTWF